MSSIFINGVSSDGRKSKMNSELHKKKLICLDPTKCIKCEWIALHLQQGNDSKDATKLTMEHFRKNYMKAYDFTETRAHTSPIGAKTKKYFYPKSRTYKQC